MIVFNISLIFWGVNWALNLHPPSGHIQTSSDTCRYPNETWNLTNYLVTGLEDYIEFGDNNINILIRDYLLPCNKVTPYFCKIKLIESKKVKVCKQFKVINFEWSTRVPIYMNYKCYNNICHNNSEINLLSQFYLKSNQGFTKIQPWVNNDTWIYDYIPTNLISVPSWNFSIQFSNNYRPRLYISVLQITVEEMTYFKGIKDFNSPQFKIAHFQIPLKSSFGGGIFKLDMDDY